MRWIVQKNLIGLYAASATPRVTNIDVKTLDRMCFYTASSEDGLMKIVCEDLNIETMSCNLENWNIIFNTFWEKGIYFIKYMSA